MPPKRKPTARPFGNGKRPKNVAQNHSHNSDSETNVKWDDISDKVDTRRRSGRLKNDGVTVKVELPKQKQEHKEKAKNNLIEVVENGPAEHSIGQRISEDALQIKDVAIHVKKSEASKLKFVNLLENKNAARRLTRRQSEILPPSEAVALEDPTPEKVKENGIRKSLPAELKTEDCTQVDGTMKQGKASYGNVFKPKINSVNRKSNCPTKQRASRPKKDDLQQKEELLTRMKANVGVGAKRKGSSSDSDFSNFSDNESDSDFDENHDSKRRKGKSRKKLPAKNNLNARRRNTKMDQLPAATGRSTLESQAGSKPSLVVEMGKLSDSESDSEFVSVGTENIIDSKELAASSFVSKVPDSIMAFPEPPKSEAADSSESEWEEVDGHLQDDDDPDREPIIPKDGVEITLEMPDILGKRRRREFDIEGYYRRKINRFKKRVQLNLHKVHLLCLLGHGMFVSQLVNNDELSAVALSIIPDELFKINRKKADIRYLERILQWFRETLSLVERDVTCQNLPDSLLASFEKCEANSARLYNILFVLILRVLHFDVRFVMSLQPLPLKPVDLIRVNPKGDDESSQPLASTAEVACTSKRKVTTTNKKRPSKTIGQSSVSRIRLSGSAKIHSETETVATHPPNDEKVPSKSQDSKSNTSKKNPVKTTTQAQAENSDYEEKRSKHGKAVSKKMDKKGTKNGRQKMPSGNQECQDAKSLETLDEEATLSRSLRRRTKKPIVDAENSEEDENEEKPADVKTKSGQGKKSANRSQGKDDDSPIWSPEDNSDSDFEVKVIRIRPSPSVMTNRRKKNRKIKSEDEADDIEVLSSTIGNDYWIEVYLDSAKKWICIDCVVGKVNCASEMEGRATQPLKYVVTFDNQNYIKDVTRRYAENWMSHTRKLRVKADWWEETLAPFRCKSTKREKDEDRALEAEQLERPLPKTIGEYKSHPLYVLQRHLLKYEALYPPDVGPIGYIRKEAVYPRECVHTCYSRESWLRLAKTVKMGEKPYKIVKGRPRWNKVLKVIEKSDQVPPLEIFGEWQVEDYDPPAAVNGKVPRNEYGNVDLYKPCMLPKGCVHLQVPGLKTVAKKLGIDCAGAVIGWDKSTWIPGPLYDGFIVCEEFADTLMAAWREQQQINEKRQREKRDKRVWGNWRRVIRGLLIRERLHVRYFSKEANDNSPEESEDVPA